MASFPEHLLPLYRKYVILPKTYGKGTSFTGAGVMTDELTRVDGSIVTMVQRNKKQNNSQEWARPN